MSGCVPTLESLVEPSPGGAGAPCTVVLGAVGLYLCCSSSCSAPHLIVRLHPSLPPRTSDPESRESPGLSRRDGLIKKILQHSVFSLKIIYFNFLLETRVVLVQWQKLTFL